MDSRSGRSGWKRLFAQQLGIETTEESKAEERRDKDPGGEPPTTGNTPESRRRDAYPAYDKFFTERGRELVEVGCWAHARRHVFSGVLVFT